MAWILDFGQIQLHLRGRKTTFGRGDFPEDMSLSRRHVEFTVEGDDVFVVDLESSNGTYLRGRRLAPNDPMKLSEGDRLRIGKTLEFTLLTAPEKELSRGKTIATTAVVSFTASAAGLISVVNYGGPIPVQLMLIALGAIAIALVVALVFWTFLLGDMSWRPKLVVIFGALVLASTAGLTWGILKAADQDWNLSDSLNEAKIEHFCLTHFDYPRCAISLNTCYACAFHIDRWKRVQMVEKLTPFVRQPASPPPPMSPSSTKPTTP